MDRLTAAKVFLEIANSGSLTQSADRLAMSHAMVSRYLAEAENWLGARLLHRTTRKVSLTEAGLAALPLCQRLLDLAEDLEYATADNGERAVQGKLRISTSPSFAESQLTAAVVAFQALYPLVGVDVVVADRTVNLVEDRIDVALRITNSLSDGVVAKRLADCHSVLCAAPSYLQQQGTPYDHLTLAAHRFVLHSRIHGKTLSLQKNGIKQELTPTALFTTNETLVLQRAVLDGAGIGILPTYMVNQDLKQGRLIHLLPDYQLETMGIYAMYLSRRHQPIALRVFLDFLSERIGRESAVWDC